MKKIVCFILFVFSFGVSFAESKKIIGFDAGLCTGLPFYGSDELTKCNDRVFDKDYRRILIGTDADVSVKIGEPLKLVFGFDFLADLIWSGSDYSNHLDYAFWGGVKVYPGFGGLNGSLAYALGCRTDYINNDVEDSICRSSAWGNGFRIGIEYDFLYGTDYKCLPAIGTYYRMMPRGNKEYDNILAVYINMSF